MSARKRGITGLALLAGVTAGVSAWVARRRRDRGAAEPSPPLT